MTARLYKDYGHPTDMAYVNLHAAFDSFSHSLLWLLLTRLGIPDKIVRLIKVLYSNSVSCVRASQSESAWFTIESGLRQGCVLAPDSFATGKDWLLERTVGSATNRVSFGPHSFSDLDFADDVALLAELLELLVPALETMATEAASLGLEVNWQKTKVQAVGSREDEPSTITAHGQEVAVVENLFILALLSTQQFKALLISHIVMPSLVQIGRTWTARYGS